MNFKTTYILFGLLGLMLVVLGIVLVNGPTAPPGVGNVFPSMKAKGNTLEAKQVDKIVIQRPKDGEADIVFERADENTWKITSPREIPADSRQITGLLDQLMNAPVDATQRSPSPSSVGLDSPARVITIHTGDRQWTLTLGDTTPGTESALVYATSSDRRGKTLPVPKQSIEAALEGLNYFRARELLGDNTSDVRAVKFTMGKQVTELKKDGERWRMAQPAYGDVDVGNLLTQLTELRVEHKDEKAPGFVRDDVTDLAQYNLDATKADVLRIDVTREQGGKTSTRTALVGISKKPDGYYYAAFDEGKTRDVVKVTPASVEPLLKWVNDPSAFRSKSLLALESFRQPDAIDIKNSYGDLRFRHADPAKPWELYRGTSPTNVDENEMRKLIGELNKKDAVVSFPDPKRRKELGLDNPDVTVKVYADSLDKPDPKKPGKPEFKKDAKPVTELHFGRPEGANVAVERVWGADKTVVMVPLSVLDQVRKGPLSYFDKTIPSFNPGAAEENVTKLELTRDRQTYVITRKPSADAWVFEQPAAYKGRTADAQAMREILGELNRLSAREIVAEKADAKDLASYDLATPRVRAAVTLTHDKKATTKTFLFGREAAGKGVYFKPGDKDTVYLVGPETLIPLNKELRDTSVLTFEPSKVATLTLKGWKDLLGAPQTRVYEQKDGNWTAKEASHTVDPAKVNEFLGELSRLRLEKFVPSGKGLTLAEDALQVELTLSDKKSLVLTVGAAEGGSYYATSSQLKGDAFLVSKTPFEKVRQKPGYFAK